MNRRLKNKIWQDNHSRKELRRLTKINKINLRTTKRNNILRAMGFQTNPKDASIIERKYICPEIFSIENNTEETISFFNDIITQIKHTKKLRKRINIYLEFSNIKSIDTDALMYLIALMKDMNSNLLKKYYFSGSYPEEEETRRIFVESGFLEYVNSRQINILPKSNRIQIRTGKNNNPNITQEVCLFVQKVCGLNRVDTIPLYNILVELMGNTRSHAYEKPILSSFSANSWYLFAEESENDIRFVFLDTGLGIPHTVYKNWHENIPFLTKDSEFICSALRGDFRSQTKMRNRSKGLPQISNECSKGFITNAKVYSGKGCCKIINHEHEKYDKIDLKNSIMGTLFSWNIEKRRA